MEVSDALYEVMTKREPTFDGRLYVGIVSTGIVCFPSCRSRLPKRQNVRVFEGLEDALAAGFRPCKRCKPDQPHSPDAELVRQVNEIIEARYAEPLTLSALASVLNVSPYHLQRTYKRYAGLSPARQLQETRLNLAKACLLDTDVPVDEIARRVGFRSVSHFSTLFHTAFGSLPSHYRLEQEGD